MTDPAKRPANAGGFIIAAALTIGTIIGLIMGQSSIGFLAGLAVGVTVAVLLWLKDRG